MNVFVIALKIVICNNFKLIQLNCMLVQFTTKIIIFAKIAMLCNNFKKVLKIMLLKGNAVVGDA